MLRKAAIATILATLPGAAAWGHAHLVGAVPAPDTVTVAPARLVMHFSERLVPSFSGATLVMTAPLAGTAPPHAIPITTKVSADGVTMVATPARPLAPGRYRVDYHTVSVDTHRVASSYDFAVR